MSQSQAPEPSARKTNASDELFVSLYQELKQYSGHLLYLWKTSGTISATLLVHETWIKLRNGELSQWESKEHFFRISAKVVRQILIDHLRQKMTAKRGSKLSAHEEFDEAIHSPTGGDDIILKVNEILEELSMENPKLADVIECRFFAGYSENETASALGLSLRSVQRYWQEAKNIIRQKMQESH